MEHGKWEIESEGGNGETGERGSGTQREDEEGVETQPKARTSNAVAAGLRYGRHTKGMLRNR